MINDDWKDNMMSIRMPPVKPLKGKGDKGRQADEEVDLNTNSLFSFLQTAKFTVSSIHRVFHAKLYNNLFHQFIVHVLGHLYKNVSLPQRLWICADMRLSEGPSIEGNHLFFSWCPDNGETDPVVDFLVKSFYAANIPTENPLKETACS